MALNPPRRRFPSTGRLPCGRSVDALWDSVVSGAELDHHSASCPHCQTALDGLRALHSATRQLVDEEVSAPPSLLERVMRVVRTEARSGETVPLVSGPDPARISTKAVAAVVRFAVDTQPGAVLRARRCEVHAPVDAVDVLDVRVEVLVPEGYRLHEAALRQRIEAVVSAHVGMRLRELTLDVVEADTREGAT
ncbi:hypothetical protein GCM10010174_30620 [Kutzneria viridogrisea]|uniref:Asp23/Gls24 family envelope stress response protein n=2 Tax=Kutzneria TaxID=43356 RepID=W5W5X3_9PSEU|nr:hypothetical protein [Kutzneria albida]AHH93594.1 hypothetical protein KALB_217 [Kutzneria albida DSM 43870]MBA8929021.1 hypothetical protein [Kutzneria viridogrisea]